MSGLDLYANYLAGLPKEELRMIARDNGVLYYGAKSRPELVADILRKNAEQAGVALVRHALDLRKEYEPFGTKVVRGTKLKALIKAIDDYNHYQQLIGLLNAKS